MARRALISVSDKSGVTLELGLRSSFIVFTTRSLKVELNDYGTEYDVEDNCRNNADNANHPWILCQWRLRREE